MVVDSNNNNNENENNEIIFWKVFHNKVLLNYILNQISETKIIVNNFKDISYENKMKFKDIQSFEWMVDKKQFQLLKCKIKSNEYLDIGLSGIFKLFQYDSNDRELIISEITKLLINHRLSDLSRMNLLYDFKNYVNNIFVKNNEYYREIYSLIEYNIDYTYSYDFTSFIEDYKNLNLNQNKIDEPILIDLNFLFRYNFDKELNQILDLLNYKKSSFTRLNSEIDNILLNNSLSSSSSLSSSLSNLALKSVEYIYSFKKNNENNNENFNKVEELHKLFSKENYYISYLNKYDKIIEQLMTDSEKISNALYYSLSTFNSNIFKIILNKVRNDRFGINQIIYKSNHQYYTYLKPINKDSESTYEFIKIITSLGGVDSVLFSTSDLNRKIYTFINSLKDGDDENLYKKAISLIPSNNEVFKNLFPLKRNDRLMDINNYGSLGVFLIHDNDTVDWIAQTEKSGPFSNNIAYISSIHSIRYTSYKVVDYAREIFKNSNSPLQFSKSFFYKNQEYEYPLIVAFHKCDIESIDHILTKTIMSSNDYHWNDYDFKLSLDERLSKIDGIETPLTVHQLIKLSNYLKSINYKNIPSQLMSVFYENVFNLIENGESSDIIINDNANANDNDNHTIDFNYLIENPKIYSDIFKNSIENVCLNKIKFILNLIPPELLFNNKINLYFSFPMFQASHNQEKPPTLLQMKQTDGLIDNLEKCLNIFIELLNSIDDPTTKTQYINSILNIINTLYDILLRIENVSIETIKYFNKLICSKNHHHHDHQIIILKDTLYRSFYYLISISPIITKYLIDLPYIQSIFDYHQMSYYHSGCYSPEDGNFYDISSYLNPKLFSFNYLFSSGLTIDEILEKLIEKLSHSYSFQYKQNNINYGYDDDEGDDEENHEENQEIQNNLGDEIGSNYEYLANSLNSDLQFCLQIRRVDLFFKQLDIIQSKLNIDSGDGGGDDSSDGGDSSEFLKRFNVVINNEIQFSMDCCDHLKSINKNSKIGLFKFSETLFILACKVLDEEEFNKFAQFGSYASIIDVLPKKLSNNSLDYLLKHSNTINHIISNHLKK
ncbi:hypothetical protein ACTFIR_002659 [Dictyostelium discoideum]